MPPNHSFDLHAAFFDHEGSLVAPSTNPQYPTENFVMHTQDPLPRSIRFISIGVLCFLLSGPGNQSPRIAKSILSTPAYIQRGNQIQEHYQSYSNRLVASYR